MTDRQGDIAGALIEAANALIEPIEGVAVIPGSANIQWRADTGAVFSVSVQGWGPSLHRRRLTWSQNLAKALSRRERLSTGEDETFVDFDLSAPNAASAIPERFKGRLEDVPVAEIVRAYEETLTRVTWLQGAYARTAAGLGIGAPLGVTNDFRETRTAHIRMARPLIDVLIAQKGPQRAADDIRKLVYEAVQLDRSNADDAISNGTLSPPVAQVTGYMGEPVLWIGTDVLGMAYDGSFLSLPLKLPETIETAAPGRRVGEIVETGVPSLDASVITHVATDDEGNTEFELKGDEMPLGEHAEMRPLMR